ncbi:MAG TPA: hypothetical protein VJJ72_01600 [Candidatus Paceibacterota bacterium]
MDYFPSLEIPPYLEKGSRGPAINILLVWLKGFFRAPDIVCDSVYGDVGAGYVKRLQGQHGLDPDGGVGPKTRRMLKEDYGFDFESVASNTGGASMFVQPDGKVLVWASSWKAFSDL